MPVSTIKNFDSKLLDYNDLRLMQVLLFGDAFLDANTKSSIFTASLDFIMSSERIEDLHF